MKQKCMFWCVLVRAIPCLGQLSILLRSQGADVGIDDAHGIYTAPLVEVMYSLQPETSTFTSFAGQQPTHPPKRPYKPD